MNIIVKQSRFTEIDIWRGSALIAMIIYHIFAILHFGGVIYIPFGKESLSILLLELIGWFARLSFIFLVGISSWLSYQRRVNKQESIKDISKHFLKRGLTIFFGGLIISAGSFKLIPSYPIYYGILSFLGTAIIVLPLILNKYSTRLIVFILFLGISHLAPIIPSLPKYITIPLGLTSPLPTVDYFPFLKWFPLILLGTLIAPILYPNAEKKCSILEKIAIKKPKILALIGQKTFILYFGHIFIILIITGILQILLQR